MTADDFRRIALALPDVDEGAHMGKADFRTGQRIFASLPSQTVGVVLLTPEQQRVVVGTAPAMFVPVKGGWGDKGATQVVLEKVTVARARDALKLAWSNRAKPPKSARAKRRTS
ncbi:MAG: hypothetical protein Q8S33_20175 [Myxococcales bacterium]|nr:hypothetical protein [Myxococcales bacterium]MDP3502667.1 hypothetical protein [Myxococcales bacterium]